MQTYVATNWPFYPQRKQMPKILSKCVVRALILPPRGTHMPNFRSSAIWRWPLLVNGHISLHQGTVTVTEFDIFFCGHRNWLSAKASRENKEVPPAVVANFANLTH